MPVSNVWVILPAVQTLKVLDADNGTLKRWQREKYISSFLSRKL